jgi:hypothetical protein
MRNRLALFALLLAAVVFAGFQLGTLKVTVEVNKDGTAHIEEKIHMFINSTDSINLYMGSLTRNDLATWKDRIGLNDIRYHVSSNVVEIRNLRIRPQPVQRCNLGAGTCEADLIFDYDVYPIMHNASIVNNTGLFITENFKPRTTRYDLNTAALSFGTTSDGDIMLPKEATLTFIIPKDSSSIYVQPLPQDLADMRPPLKGVTTFAWGNTVLPKFEFTFEREESLETEILQFFQSIQNYISAAIYGPQGLAILLILLVAAGSLVYLNTVKKKK